VFILPLSTPVSNFHIETTGDQVAFILQDVTWYHSKSAAKQAAAFLFECAHSPAGIRTLVINGVKISLSEESAKAIANYLVEWTLDDA
jgi:hypothetical protein